MPAIPAKDAKCRAIEALITAGKGVCESCREVDVGAAATNACFHTSHIRFTS